MRTSRAQISQKSDDKIEEIKKNLARELEHSSSEEVELNMPNESLTSPKRFSTEVNDKRKYILEGDSNIEEPDGRSMAEIHSISLDDD